MFLLIMINNQSFKAYSTYSWGSKYSLTPSLGTEKITTESGGQPEETYLFFSIYPFPQIAFRLWKLLLLLLLLLSRFSHVQICATPETAAHQAPPSLGFSRQEHWGGLPFPSPMHESEKWKWSRSVVSESCDPMDCSPPGSSVHGIF